VKTGTPCDALALYPWLKCKLVSGRRVKKRALYLEKDFTLRVNIWLGDMHAGRIEVVNKTINVQF